MWRGGNGEGCGKEEMMERGGGGERIREDVEEGDHEGK